MPPSSGPTRVAHGVVASQRARHRHAFAAGHPNGPQAGRAPVPRPIPMKVTRAPRPTSGRLGGETAEQHRHTGAGDRRRNHETAPGGTGALDRHVTHGGDRRDLAGLAGRNETATSVTGPTNIEISRCRARRRDHRRADRDRTWRAWSRATRRCRCRARPRQRRDELDHERLESAALMTCLRLARWPVRAPSLAAGR